jgi:hypothetical protein
MLVQDSQTGYFHEVPDHHVAGYGQVLYDGLGNPVGIGWNPFSVVSKVVNAVRGVASAIPTVGRMVGNMITGASAPTPTQYPYSYPYSYPYQQTQPYQAPQDPPNMPGADMANSMSPEGYPSPTTPMSPWPYGQGGAWRRRRYWRGHGRYRPWSRGWRRSYGYGYRPWRLR